MVTKLVKRIARWVLRDELKHLSAVLQSTTRSLLIAQQSREHYYKRYVDRTNQAGTLSAYVQWLYDNKQVPIGDTELLFMRDYARDGEKGPNANSHGVHPALRWNCKSFMKFEEVTGR